MSDFSLLSTISRVFRSRTTRDPSPRVVLVTPPSSTVPFYSTSPSQGQSSTVPTIPLLPLGPAYLAASLEQVGVDVKIVDLTFTMEDRLNLDHLTNTILNHQPHIVGVSAFTSTILSAYKIANAVKQEQPELPIIVGGPHATALPHRTLDECPGFDAAIVGEGEHVFRDLCSTLFTKGSPAEFPMMNGVVFRSENTTLGDSKPVYVKNLDALPFPARHLFNLHKYNEVSHFFNAKTSPVASIVTSRGCPHACLYCARINSGYRFRARSPENVLLELEELQRQGYREVQIVDDDFTEDRSRVLQLCTLIKERAVNLNLNLLGGLRVDRIDEELLRRMYEAGCYAIHFGAESGDDAVLQYNRKGVTAQQIKDAVHLAKQIGYTVILYIIIGLPGSSLESEQKTFDLITECAPDATRASVCTPYPGSPLWETLKDQLDDVSWDRYNESDVTHPIFSTHTLRKAQLQFWMDLVGVQIT